jgi:DNA-binding FadR family transcriptional regulator
MADSEGNAAIPYADVGARFGVSRTHVRTLLVAAEARGLVRLQGRGGRRVEILPALWTAYDRSLATGMYLLDMVYAVVTGRRSQARND